MTKILVVSDSHCNEWRFREAIEKEPTAKIVFFLGDGAREAERLKEKYPHKFFHLVTGNCDWGVNLPESVTDEIEGIRIYACHGHTHLVKHGTEMLLEHARSIKARIALYGHTHVPAINFCDGVYLINPGCMRDGSYCVIDISGNGVLPVLRNLN